MRFIKNALDRSIFEIEKCSFATQNRVRYHIEYLQYVDHECKDVADEKDGDHAEEHHGQAYLLPLAPDQLDEDDYCQNIINLVSVVLFFVALLISL